MIALHLNATYDESLFLEGMMPQLTSVFGPVQEDLKNGFYKSAFKKLISASNEYSHNETFLSLLAETQRGLHDAAGLVKTLQVLARTTKNHETQLELMRALYVEGRLNEALDVGLALQDEFLPPVQHRQLLHILSKIYLEFNDYEGVRELAQLCEPDEVMIWALGCAQLAEGQLDEALLSFRGAVQMNPDYDQAWVSLALVHEHMGDRHLALANIEKALDINAHNSTGLKLLAKWQTGDLNKIKVVRSRIEFYLSRYDFDEEMSLCLVNMLRESGELDRARFEMERLILSNPQSPQLHEIKKDLENQLNLC